MSKLPSQITEEQLKALREGNDERFTELMGEIKVELKQAVQKYLTVEERLQRRSTLKTIPTVLLDEFDQELTLQQKIYPPAIRKEVVVLLAKQRALDQDSPKIADEAEEIFLAFRVICKKVVVNVSSQFWDSEQATNDIVQAVILNGLTKESEFSLEGIKGFRRKPEG